MAKKKEEKEQPVQETPEKIAETAAEEQQDPVNPFEEKYNAEHDAYLRLAADYDNFRKRSAKEREQLYAAGKADAVQKLLPVYDNLERALNQETADEAYKKGVEMTLNELVRILESLGVSVFGEAGEVFDPNIHNAVMHIEDETAGENTIVQVFQKGFKLGEKIIRFAMVQVAN